MKSQCLIQVQLSKHDSEIIKITTTHIVFCFSVLNYVSRILKLVLIALELQLLFVFYKNESLFS